MYLDRSSNAGYTACLECRKFRHLILKKREGNSDICGNQKIVTVELGCNLRHRGLKVQKMK
jgi:hypothetical protein